jgi:hypothetical protein
LGDQGICLSLGHALAHPGIGDANFRLYQQGCQRAFSRCEFLRTATASGIGLLTSEENSRLQREDGGGCVCGLFSRVG